MCPDFLSVQADFPDQFGSVTKCVDYAGAANGSGETQESYIKVKPILEIHGRRTKEF